MSERHEGLKALMNLNLNETLRHLNDDQNKMIELISELTSHQAENGDYVSDILIDFNLI